MRTDRFDKETIEEWQARLRRQSAYWAEESAYWNRRSEKLYRRGLVINITQLVLVLILAGWLFAYQFLWR